MYLKEVSKSVLTQVQKEMYERNIRSSIYPIRNGGDEFLIIVPKVLIYNSFCDDNYTYSKALLNKNELKNRFDSLERLIKDLGKITLYKKRKK